MQDNIKDLKDIAQILTLAIAQEESSYDLYKAAGGKAESPLAKEVFAILTQQEKEHQVRLRELLRRIDEQIAKEKKELKGK